MARAEGYPGALGKLGLAAGSTICSVSFSLFIHTISHLSSPIVTAMFISAGIVARRRVTTPAGQAIALGVIVGGVIAAIAAIALVAADR